MIRFRWWSHNSRHLSRKLTGPSWHPGSALPPAKDDITLAATALALPALKSATENARNTDAIDASTHPATNIQAHVIATSPLHSQHSSYSVSDQSSFSLSPIAPSSQRRSKKTDVLPQLTIPTTPSAPSVRPALLPQTGIQIADRQVFEAPYTLPLDTTEISRLDFQHYVLRQSLGGNYAAPIDNPRSILDVGTGTGRWGTELASVFSEASVVGTDLVPPPLSQHPRNFVFVRNNVLEGLPFADGCFDFVHQRLLLFSIPMNKLRLLISELVRVTATNGWIELVEADVNVQQSGPANRKMVQWAVEASRMHGIEPNLSARIGDFLRLMHLKHVEVRSITLPLGQWGGRIGRMMAADMAALAQGMKSRLLAHKGVSSEEYEHTCLQMQQEWELYHSKLIFYIAYGKRE